MIPRILHYVWLGGGRLPEKFRVNIETWRWTNPDFEIRAWTEDSVALDGPYLETCRRLGNWANASNYLRLQKVAEHGGLYLDVDVMLRGPLDRLLRHRCFFGFQVEPRERDWVNNAVFGAEPGHWFIDQMRTRLLAEFDGAEPANHSAPRLLTRMLEELGLDRYDPRGVELDGIRIEPCPVFYPYSWRERFSLDCVRPETLAVHFWAKSWHPAADAAAADDAAMRAQLEALELEHQRLIAEALARPPRRSWWQRLTARRGAAALAAVLAGCAMPLADAAGWTPSDCGQVFDPPPSRAGAETSMYRPACSADPASPRHCLGFAPDPGDGIAASLALGGAGEHAYQLWLKLETPVRPPPLAIGLSGRETAAWWPPASSPAAWQKVTGADIAVPRRFTPAGQDARLTIAPATDGAAAEPVNRCVLLTADPAFVPDIAAVHRIDQVWSGTGAPFDGLADAHRVYVGYYDAARNLTVAAYDRRSGEWQRRSVPSRFAGWDNHNAIALALDHDGNLHVAGNMHASPLVYGRTRVPGRLDTLALVDRMTGIGEQRATYPSWTTLPDGSLAFRYRDGTSGSGQYVVNRFAEGVWSRLGAAVLFARHDGARNVTAYPHAVVPGPDGRFHMAWVWRSGPGAANTFQVAYARSVDLAAWEDGAGRALALPILPGGGDVIDDVPKHAGLSNQLALGFDAAGRPIVSYLKFDAAGHTQLFNARRAGDAWQIVQATSWRDRWDQVGTGTLQGMIRVEAIAPVAEAPMQDAVLRQPLRHWREGRFDLLLDAASLRSVGARAPVRPLPDILLRPAIAEPGYFAMTAPVRGADGARYVLRWDAQANYSDAAPDCTPQRPRACRPPPATLTLWERR